MKFTSQNLRHSVQFLVVLFILTTPLLAQYGRYLYDNRLDTVLYEWASSVQKSGLIATDLIFKGSSVDADRSDVLNYLAKYQGNSWSAKIHNVSMCDPLGGIGSIFASQSISITVLTALIIPVLATVILGRVFCSWICPIGFLLDITDKLRRPFLWMKLPVRNIPLQRGNKFGLLAVGMMLTVLVGYPLLNEIYPPALIQQEIQSETGFLFDRAENRQFEFSLGGLTWISLFIFLIILIELFVSRRMWCRYLCPGGALYSILGSKRAVRIRRNSTKCTDCGDCTKACPMGLNPMKDSTGVECDNCLACVSVCSEDALKTHLSLKSTPIK